MYGVCAKIEMLLSKTTTDYLKEFLPVKPTVLFKLPKSEALNRHTPVVSLPLYQTGKEYASPI